MNHFVHQRNKILVKRVKQQHKQQQIIKQSKSARSKAIFNFYYQIIRQFLCSSYTNLLQNLFFLDV